MSTDTSRTRDDDTQSAAIAERDRRAERATAARTSDNGASGHQPAETRTRGDHADAMHARPPIRYDQPGPDGDSRKDRQPGEPRSEPADPRDQAGGRDRDADTDRARHDRDGSRHDKPAAGPGDRPRNAESSRPADEGRTPERAGTESRTRGQDDAGQADIRPDTHGNAVNQDADQPSEHGPVTHFYAEFKGQQMDLYTDGTRWAATDRPRSEDIASINPDALDHPPTGEELVEDAGENSSLLDRLRKETYRESDDAIDSIEKGVNLGHDVFTRPPTGSYEGTPSDQPNISPAQHSGIDAGTAATAIFVLGLAIERGIHSIMRYAKKHAEGE